MVNISHAQLVSFSYRLGAKTYKGEFVALWWAEKENGEKMFFSQQKHAVLDFKGSSKQIIVQVNQLSWGADHKGKELKLVFFPSMQTQVPGLKGPRRNYTLPEGKSVDMPYLIQKKAIGNIKIPFQIQQVKKKKTFLIGEGDIRKSYTLKGVGKARPPTQPPQTTYTPPKAPEYPPQTNQENHTTTTTTTNPHTDGEELEEVEIKKSEEEIMWEQARKKDDTTSYNAYLRKYPRGEFVSKAQKALFRKLPIHFQMKRLQDTFKISLQYVTDPQIRFEPSEGISHELQDSLLTVVLQERKPFTLYISDSNGKDTSLVLDNSVKALAGSLEEAVEGQWTMKITGGVPPYYIQFLRSEQWFSLHEIEIGKEPKFQLTRELVPSHLNGEFQIRLLDSRRTEMAILGGIKLKKPFRIPMWLWGLPVLALMIWVIYRNNKRKRRYSPEYRDDEDDEVDIRITRIEK